MAADCQPFKESGNIYLNRFTIGVVYEGVKEILYNNQHYKLPPGTLFCLGFANHKVYNNPDSYNDYLEVTIDYSYEEIAEIKLSDIPNFYRIKERYTPLNKLSLIGNTQTNAQIEEIFDNIRYDSRLGELSATKRMATLILLLAADHSNTILQTILHNLDRRLIHLNEVLRRGVLPNNSIERGEKGADDTKISTKTLNQLCRLKFGYSPHDLTLKLRLDKAKWELQFTDNTIANIATSCGFKDCSYFTKVFRRHLGVTPRQYRAESWQRCQNEK